jgi:hypothetical protein
MLGIVYKEQYLWNGLFATNRRLALRPMKQMPTLADISYFFLKNQTDPLIIQIYSVIKLYMFRASSLPIIRSSLLYMRHW